MVVEGSATGLVVGLVVGLVTVGVTSEITTVVISEAGVNSDCPVRGRRAFGRPFFDWLMDLFRVRFDVAGVQYDPLSSDLGIRFGLG